LRRIETKNGFGSSVVQRLCKTSVKKNLYWEVKEKVIEEAFNGMRMQPQARKVKVYGLDSTKNVRARLIEILMERVMYHKDKFISPILYNEMRTMEIKKSGKVEHSDKEHDDQVFSYLMALYVWYDGKNLIENFGIRKTTLRTDQNDDLEEATFEDAIEKREKLDYNSIIRDDIDSDKLNEIYDDLEWISGQKFVTSDQLQAAQSMELYTGRNKLMYNDKNAAKAASDSVTMGVVLNPIESSPMVFQTSLPDKLFLDDDYSSYDLDDYDSNGRPVSNNGVPLAGNLSSWYDNL